MHNSKLNFSKIDNCHHSVTERRIYAYFQNLLQINKIVYKYAQNDYFHEKITNSSPESIPISGSKPGESDHTSIHHVIIYFRFGTISKLNYFKILLNNLM